jgi:hypothetical protein
LAPQQTSAPFVLNPQVWLLPAPIAVNVPEGDVAWPKALFPQQATVPLTLMPQL